MSYLKTSNNNNQPQAFLLTNDVRDEVPHPHGGKKSACTLVGCMAAAILVLVVVAVVLQVLILSRNQSDVNTKLGAINDKLATVSRPVYKYAVDSVPPAVFQYMRGTCWDFGTIGAVEHQYRLQGIAQGFLKPNEYVRLSEQAYGNVIIELCQKNQTKCLLPQDMVAFNSTEGGEAILLYSFAEELQTMILPDAVCPYIRDSDNSSCPGIDGALKKNPINVTVKSMKTYYDVPAIQRALQDNAYSMPLSIGITGANYYTPCSDPSNKNNTQCTSVPCQPCPADMGFGQCCVKHSAAMFNMEGEFGKHHELELEGGHVMLLVGFNDEYVTKDGFKGGFIVRNTWVDGAYQMGSDGWRARGSHSLPYFMGEISESDERLLCPNVQNPRNWYPCGDPSSQTPAQMAQTCAAFFNNATATAEFQPLSLNCRDPTQCDATMTYYSINSTVYGDSLQVMCFLKVDPANPASASDLCLSPRPIDEVALVFAPNMDLPNLVDFCGFYFFPYDLVREIKATFGGTFVTDYALSFSSGSYLANKDAAENAKFDYSFLGNSTRTQEVAPKFVSPYAVPPQTGVNVTAPASALPARMGRSKLPRRAARKPVRLV